MNKPKILFYDIECLNLNADLSPILCIGLKWLGEPAKCLSIWQKSYKMDGPFSKRDNKLCEKLIEVFSEADYICGHYSQRFDRPFINTRLLKHNLPPIDRDIKNIDTWRIARDHLKLTSNRLKNLGKFFELAEQKGDSGGFDTWQDAIIGSKEAREKLVTYCMQDVISLEALYLKLRPFDRSINHSLFSGRSDTKCPTCGSQSSVAKGTVKTRTMVYQRRLCSKCSRYFKVNKQGFTS